MTVIRNIVCGRVMIDETFFLQNQISMYMGSMLTFYFVTDFHNLSHSKHTDHLQTQERAAIHIMLL